MKRVRCPKCDTFITFDESKYESGQSLVFECPNCQKQFGIRMGVSKLRAPQKEEHPDEHANEEGFGSIVVIENVFHYKQVLPLRMGDNTIGRRPSEVRAARRSQLYRHLCGQRDTWRPRAPCDRRRYPVHYRCHEHHTSQCR